MSIIDAKDLGCNKPEPTIQKELKKGIDIISLQRTLAYYLLN